MPPKKNPSVSGPAVAIALIVVCVVVYQFWFVPKPAASPPPAQPPAASPDPENLPTSPQTPVASPGDVSIAEIWSTYHGGTDLSGYSDTVVPDKPAVLWQYIAEGDIRQPAVANDSGMYVATTNGLVVALDFHGQERWKKQLARSAIDGTNKPERLAAPIACFRSTVVIGSNAGIVHALDTETGDARWTHDVGGEVLGSVNFFAPGEAAGTALLYVIERGEGVLQCIDFDTGAEVWRTDPIARTDGSLAIAGGTLVYGSCAFALHVYGAQEGRRINTIALCGDCQVASGPAVIGDEIYSGSRSGHIFRADAQTGAIVWMNQDCTKEVFTTPAIGKDVAVFGSEDGKVYGLHRDSGLQKWSVDVGGLPTSAVIASEKVIVGADGVVLFLTLESGEEIWRYEVSDGIASPSIINGMVVVGSEDGTVIAFGAMPNP